MEKVTGIGGIFFRAENPGNLSEWYEKNLGITPVPKSYEEDSWSQVSGPTVFAPFNKDSDYFGRDSQQWMLNFRVANLPAMVAQLQTAGIEIVVDEESYPNGTFARLYDPEGNPIELWQPKS